MSLVQVVVLRCLIRYSALFKRGVFGEDQFVFPAFSSACVMMLMTVRVLMGQVQSRVMIRCYTMLSRGIERNINCDVVVLWYHHGQKYDEEG